MNETADSLDKISFQLHDFGYRGVSSVEVSIGLNLKSSDYLIYYLLNIESKQPLVGPHISSTF
jgi:hypothetical protein